MRTAPFDKRPRTAQHVMLWVLLALVPALAVYGLHFGPGVVVQVVLSVVFALLFEWLCLKVRKQPIKLFLTDGSAVVTAVLFALCISPLSPWYVALIGMLFAIVLGKHLYGGLGHNIFNPAMVGFAAILIAFPQSMALWLAPLGMEQNGLDWSELLSVIFVGSEQVSLDAVTAATPLSAIQTGFQQSMTFTEIRAQAIFGSFGGMGWEWVAMMSALGGLLLWVKKIITWHVPVVLLSSVVVFSSLLHVMDPDVYWSPTQHLFSGGVVLAAFFIATDPTSGCSSVRGKMVFAMGVAVLTVLIRQFGAFPDGVAFAVLLMNMAAPLIDQVTIPKPYGRQEKHES